MLWSLGLCPLVKMIKKCHLGETSNQNERTSWFTRLYNHLQYNLNQEIDSTLAKIIPLCTYHTIFLFTSISTLDEKLILGNMMYNLTMGMNVLLIFSCHLP